MPRDRHATGCCFRSRSSRSFLLHVEIVSQAIKRHDLRRSAVNDHFVGEGSIMHNKIGFPTTERFAMNAPQLNLDDTPDTVAKEMLRPTACAFADIIRQLDAMPRNQTGTNPYQKLGPSGS